jgi:hypothetical protein
MKDEQAEIEATTRLVGERIGAVINRRHGQRIGFALFLFEYGAGGLTTYVGSVKREEMKGALEEVLARIKGELAELSGDAEGGAAGPRERGH